MRILHRDDMRMRLRCESDDDLWTLAQFVQPGQRFGMVGERRDSTTGAVEGGRAKAAERRTMWILLDVISVEHHTFSDALRVHGTIVEAAFDQGQHHTHVVEAGHEVEVHTNTAFRPIDVQLIKEAASAALRPKVALVVVEHDEVILFTVAQRGLKEGMTWTMRGGGKRNDERTSSGVKEAFLTNTAKEISAALVGDVPVVLAGPGHARDRLAAALRVCAPDLSLTSVATSIGGRSAANEVIREGLAGAVLADHAVSRETGLVEEAMTRIQTSGLWPTAWPTFLALWTREPWKPWSCSPTCYAEKTPTAGNRCARPSTTSVEPSSNVPGTTMLGHNWTASVARWP